MTETLPGDEPAIWIRANVDTEELPIITGAIPHVHRHRPVMTVERPRGAPMFQLPVPPVRYVPVVRRQGFTVEPPSWVPSTVLEAEHSRWARRRPDLALWGVPRRGEILAGVVGAFLAGLALGVAWFTQAAEVVLP